jgi:hypothetical protein
MSLSSKVSERDLMLYLEGRLHSDRINEINKIIASDPAARKELISLEQVLADIEDLPLPPVPQASLETARSRLFSSINCLEETIDLEETRPVRLDLSPNHVQKRRVTDVKNLHKLFYWPSFAAALIIGIFIGDNLLQNPFNDVSRATGQQNPSLVSVDGARQTKPWEGVPMSRKYAVQDLNVDSDKAVKILLDETSSYEISGQTDDLEMQEYLNYIVRNDVNTTRRITAIRLLEEGGINEESKTVMVYALSNDPDLEVRITAFNALLQHLGDSKVRQAFIKVMMDDPSHELRNKALSAIGNTSISRPVEVNELGRK